MGRIGFLQVLRAYAALWVVWRHTYYPDFEVGVFGVDVFFVISGFIMAYICAGQSISPGRFILRRALRIAPLYWLMTCATFSVAVLAPRLLNSTTASTASLVKSLAFVPYLKENGTVMPMIPVGWTLNYEMLFYAAVAVCLAVSRRHAPLMAAAALAMLPLIIEADPADSPRAWFYAQPIIGEFLLGVLVFVVWRRLRLAELPVPIIAGVLAMSAVALPVLEWKLLAQASFEGRLYMFGVPAALLVLSATLLDGQSPALKPIENRVSLALGDASYAIYLSHLFVIEGLRKVVFPRTGLFDMETFAGAFAALAIAAAVGVIVHRWIERPLMRLREMPAERSGFNDAAVEASTATNIAAIEVSKRQG